MVAHPAPAALLLAMGQVVPPVGHHFQVIDLDAIVTQLRDPQGDSVQVWEPQR